MNFQSRLLPLAMCVLPGMLAAQAGAPGDTQSSSRTIQLLVQGSIDQVRVTSAWSRDFAFETLARHDNPTGWIRLYDAQGDELTNVHFDLSTVNRDRGANKGQQIVHGDVLLEGSVTRLVKIPDLGAQMAYMTFESIEEGKTVQLGSTTRAELERVLFTSKSVGPLGALTVRTHLNNGPVANRYDIVCLGDAYRTSDETQFVADVNAWIANLFAKEPYKTYKKFFNVHSVFRNSVENLADKPNPCTNPPVVRNTVYNASYCVGGTDRCLYISNTTLASQDAAQAPDVEGRIVVFVNDPKYGGCASTFAVSYNGSSGPEVQSHEFGHSFGGLADEYDYGRSGTYTGPEPGNANITADSNCTKWQLWKGTNGINCFQGAGYYLTGLYRPKSNCLMRNLGVALCEVCQEELVLDGYTTVNPIEAPVPSSTSVTLTKPATQTFSFTNLVPATSNPRVRWYVDNVLKQTGSSASYNLASTTLSAGTHTVRLEVFDQTTMVRKDTANKRTRTRTWSVIVRDGGAYTTYGVGCSGSGGAGNGAVGPKAFSAQFGNSANSYPLGTSNIRYQQVFIGSEIGARTIGGIAFRHDEQQVAPAGSTTLRVRIGHTTLTPATIGTTSTFASNFNSGGSVLVYDGVYSWPANSPANNDASAFLPTITFTQPFQFDGTRNLLVEIENYGTTNFACYMDAFNSGNSTRIWALPRASTPTGIGRNYGIVMCFLDAPAGQVLPAAYKSTIGTSQNSYPFGWSSLRYQQVFDGAETQSAIFTGISLRYGSYSGTNAGGARQLALWLGDTSFTPATLTTTYDSNFVSGTKRSVFTGTVNLPTVTGANSNPSLWQFHVPFTAPYVHTRNASRDLLIEVINSSANALGNYLDATSSGNTTRLYATSTTATTGSLGQNYGLVMRFNTSGRAGSTPVALDHVGVPTLGNSFQITLANAPAGALAAIWVGFAKTNIPLPSNLAPGCSLYASLDVFPLTGRVADSSGFASVNYPIPNDTRFRGVKFYNEWFVFDKPANPLGLTFTNGGEATIGG
ncbi:MAG: hypothetical protein KDC95_10000 [Planctomycetes bacterium]|nr:hypothetical protein [Planctomycetota bacterium]